MKYKIKKNLIFEKKTKKITIFDSEKSIIYELNEIGSLILKKIKNGKTTEEISNILEKKFIEKNPQFNPTQSKFEVKNYNGFKIGEGIPFIGFEWEYSYEP